MFLLLQKFRKHTYFHMYGAYSLNMFKKRNMYEHV